MAENSKIEWCDHTVNFVIGCVEVSEECARCYAKSLDARYRWGGATHWGVTAPRLIRSEKAHSECVRLNGKAAKQGRIDKVFINSLSDTFEDRRDLDCARSSLYHAIQVCPNLIFMLLTKRPEKVIDLIPDQWMDGLPDNVWVGTTTGTQKRADELIPELLKIPAKVRFLSVEPMLEKISLSRWTTPQCELCANNPWHETNHSYFGWKAPIDWVINGGESGPKKRPINVDWMRSIRDQCRSGKVAYFCKQVDKVQPIPDDLMIREFPV